MDPLATEDKVPNCEWMDEVLNRSGRRAEDPFSSSVPSKGLQIPTTINFQSTQCKPLIITSTVLGVD